MRSLMIVIAFVLAPQLAAAQTGSGSAGSGSAAAAGSAATAGSGSAGSGAKTGGELNGDPYQHTATSSAGAPSPDAPDHGGGMARLPDPSPAELRKICADAMNADPNFAQAIVETINADTARQHAQAGAAIAKNEKHVIMAYAAMWVIAALFLMFLWRRQQGLKTEIAQLKRDLEAATKS